jgi:hypothetical protein
MADRYQDKPFSPHDDYDRGVDEHAPARGDSDPLAELARLIGQTDPFGSMGRANLPVQPRDSGRDRYQPEPDDGPPAGPPPWMQRAAQQEIPQQDYPSAVHPLHRRAIPVAAPEPDYQETATFEDDRDLDPSRYDDALYGQLDSGEQEAHHNPAYGDGDYAYQDGYGEEGDENPPQKRRSGMLTVVAVIALAVVGTGGAFAYRTYIGAAHGGEPPIIKADTGPTKIVPTPADGGTKLPDRLATGDGTEKIVPREEAPVDVNAQPGPRVVLPPLTPNINPPAVASVSPAAPPPASNGTLPSSEPRKIKTLSVHGDQPDAAAAPVAPAPAAKPVPAVPRTSATQPANAPLSLVPQGVQPAPAAEPRTRVAATTAPVQAAPSAGGGYLVQVSSQKNEADAQASYRVLQGKFPSVLGSRTALIRRADLGDKGIYYRAMVGPFGSPDEAAQFCGSLKTAGGQCVVQRN